MQHPSAAMADAPAPLAGAAGASAQYITCTLDDAEFGIDIMAVHEIRGWTPPTAIPHAAAWMRGVTNLRGTIVPIVDLRARFGFGPTEPGAMHVVVIIQNGARTAGLLVDAVSDIVTVEAGRIRPVPEIGAAAPERLLSGLVPLERGMVSLVSLDTLLAFDEADTAPSLPIS
ncbi:chemotaxis protein CheW [Roseomonas sp. CECT 9278]|uniref:chemotaxis protein CheW n=1 Tax=Roseomonas sp. CECT 9278 TaxID=2845823 RepID=UPI001E540BB6|nr:chemotaxis protein CheW [Roseomonas sp. CECT 9278]CAH0200462.1 Chemotaxis protein CheW [Roseomonas sp. CECT 9278]